MRSFVSYTILMFFIFVLLVVRQSGYFDEKAAGGAPPYGESQEDIPAVTNYWANWKRPIGPAKVALQVGHWKNSEFPDELSKLRNNTGASGGGKIEWEVNLVIAQATAKILEQQGVNVEILPATVPPKYWADVFIAIHADGSADKTKSGYKISGPWRDMTGNSETLVSVLSESYEKTTGFMKDDNITKNMRGYYAFSFWKYEHAVHPMTTSAIIETGFLSSYSDQLVLINNPEIPAKGIADGIINYLDSKGLF